MFDNPNVFYTNNPKIIFDDEWLLDQNKIQKLKQHKLSVLDFSSEHYGGNGLDYVYHTLNENNINFLLLSHEPSDHLKYDRMLFYPHWYHWARKNFTTSNNLNFVDKTYSWSCLNASPRPHRIYNYFYSKQQSYYESAYFTFHNADIHRPDDVTLSQEVLNFWDNIKNTLPNRETINQGPRADSRLDLPANSDAYVHLVTETTVIPRIFLSEKTWKPIASGQIFLIFGNLGIVDHLRKQGVDVFDDIIDHTYDSTANWQLRLHQIHQQLKRLIDMDLKQLYINTLVRRQTNIEKFFSGAFDKQYHQTLIECINTQS